MNIIVNIRLIDRLFDGSTSSMHVQDVSNFKTTSTRYSKEYLEVNVTENVQLVFVDINIITLIATLHKY